MAGYFLDSSAIAKHYHFEVGSDAVTALTIHGAGALYISRLATVEVPSAFAGKVRTGKISGTDFALLAMRFRRDLRSRVFRTIAIRAGHFKAADRLIKTHGTDSSLRTLDAIQLAVALDLRQSGIVDTFVCADSGLCLMARKLGFLVLNPQTVERT